MNINLNNIFREKEVKQINLKEKIIYNLKRREIEKNKNYKIILKSCLKLIENSINDNQSDLLFTISSTIPSCSDYNSSECLKYIAKKLMKNNLNAYIIDENNIFISWNSIKL